MSTDRPCCRRHAFTLVELLVVIGIVALLVSILLPVLNRARESAQRTRCASNLRQFFMGDEMYKQNEHGSWHLPGFWGGRLPIGTNPALVVTAANNTYQYNRTWPGQYVFRKALDMPISTDTNLNCYVERDKWYCPTALRGTTESFDSTSNATVAPMEYSYGMNVQGIDEDNGLHGSSPAQDVPAPPQVLVPKGFHGYHRSHVRRPAEKLMFVDANWVLVNVWGSGVTPGWNGKISNYDVTKEYTNTGTIPGVGAYDVTRSTAWRHKGGANVCFFDGHVQWLHKDEIYARDASGNIAPNMRLWDVMK